MSRRVKARETGATPARWPEPLLVALVVGATLVTFWPSLHGAFIWNDSDYVTRPDLRSLAGLGRIWTKLGATQQYYPLLHSLFWVQARLWGDHVLGYHLVSVATHAASAVLFGVLLTRLRVPGAWIGAMLFALHPVHVQSVAWITEQKNTWSLLFHLGAALAYLRFDQTRRRGAWFAALALFVLSLLCKTATATLPAALLVVFWWQRGRLEWRRDVAPLLSWLVLAFGYAVFTAWVERTYLRAQGADFDLSLPARVLVAGHAICFYAGKLVWPFGLNFVYPRWSIDPLALSQWCWPLAAVALAVALWGLRHRTRTPLAVFLVFVGSLVPVLGFVNLYGSLYSFVWDHWQYLADLAPLALAGAGGARIVAWTEGRTRFAGAAATVGLAVVLGLVSARRCGDFRDLETLYRTTLARNAEAWMAEYNLAALLAKTGRSAEALVHYRAAARLRPDEAVIRVNYGEALGEFPEHRDEAIAEMRAALQLKPDLPVAHYNLAFLLAGKSGQTAEAIQELETTLRLKPDDRQARLLLGSLLAPTPERRAEAIRYFESLLRENPADADAHFDLGIVHANFTKETDRAIEDFAAAVRARPDFYAARVNLGLALLQTPDRWPEAEAQFAAAVRLQPDNAGAHYDLGMVLSRLPGREAEALAHFRTVRRLRPDFEPARQMIDRLSQAR